VDILPDSQQLVTSSLMINGDPLVEDEDYLIVDNRLEIYLETFNDKKEITFTTKLKEDTLLNALNNGKESILVTNNAYLEHGEGETTFADHASTITIPLKILNKTGELLTGTTLNQSKIIKWTVEVNEDELAFVNPTVTDTLPTGLNYVSNTAKLVKE